MAGWMLSSGPSLPAFASAVVLRLLQKRVQGWSGALRRPLRLRLAGGHREVCLLVWGQPGLTLGGEPGADSWKEEQQEWAREPSRAAWAGEATRRAVRERGPVGPGGSAGGRGASRAAAGLRARLEAPGAQG